MGYSFPLDQELRIASAAEELDSWQQGGKWFRYHEHAIFSRMEGRGRTPIVLLHGFPTASWDWHALWPGLTEKHLCITLDMIGFGFSDKPANYAYSLVDQADLISGFLEELNVERCHILAHDYGDSVAQELLYRQQIGSNRFHIESMCFLNGTLFPESHRPLFMQKLLASPFGALVSRVINRKVFDSNMQRLFSPKCQPDEALLDNLWALLVYNNGLTNLHRLIHYMEERRCHRNRWVGALQSADIPLRFINGITDPVCGQVMADRFEELVQNADVVRLEGVGHYPQLEAPARVMSVYQEFLEIV